MAGEIERAVALLEQAVILKERSLGSEHPDVALSLDSLACALVTLERPNDALVAANRAVAIHAERTDPKSLMLASALSSQGQSLFALGRTSEARTAFERALRDVDSRLVNDSPLLADAKAGLGQLELAEGRPRVAIPLLEKAIRTYERYQQGNTVFASSSRFTMARALWEVGDRRRASALAIQARDAYAGKQRTKRADEIDAWLASRSTIPGRKLSYVSQTR
jgi:eukaryotic-like serine/threonine-protein kinase